jgi:hypothetical protein
VDYYSNWFEYEAVSKITSEAVISSMKRIFSRLGIPEKMITDNGRQFISREFQEFAKKYGMQHTTVSPKHPQANGKAEKAVGVCKNLMKKSIEGKTDFYLALLEWRNIPQAEIGLSPAQRLYGRRLRGVVPTISKQLEPELYPGVQEKMKISKDKQKQWYDRGSRPLKDLAVGDTIRLKLPGSETWSKGQVTGRRGTRSYRVRVDGKVYVRNRRQLIQTSEPMEDELDWPQDEGDQQQIMTDEPLLVAPEPRRPQRERKRPERYGSWVNS